VTELEIDGLKQSWKKAYSRSMKDTCGEDMKNVEEERTKSKKNDQAQPVP